jgi:hypothetical protein
MFIDFKLQLKWFTKRLLQLRLTKVKGFGLPITFELSEISNNSVVEFDSNMPVKDHLEDLTEEIKEHYIQNSKTPVSGDNIKLKYSEDGTKVKIYGINSNLLRSFIIEKLEDQTSLFRTTSNGSLLYVEIPTNVTLSATESDIFSKLRLNKDNGIGTLSYSEIFEICASHKGPTLDEFMNHYNTDTKRDTVSRSTISYMLAKIRRSPMFETIESDKIIKNVTKEGYLLLM